MILATKLSSAGLIRFGKDDAPEFEDKEDEELIDVLLERSEMLE